MRRLPLYKGAPRTPIELEQPLDVDHSCTRCVLHEGPKTVCLPPEGEPGGLLLIGESPGSNEDLRGRPFIGRSGQLLRPLVKQWWKGPVAIANAIGCAPGRRPVKEKHVESCRPFLASTVREVQPTRVVTLGSWATYAVTGRKVPPLASRRAYSYLFGVCDEPVPVFHVLHPAAALRNRFVRRAFEDDLRWALETPAPRAAPVMATFYEVENERDAETVLGLLDEEAPWTTFDIESAGKLWEPSYRLLSVALCSAGSAQAFVWGRTALADPMATAHLIGWLEDEGAPKIGHSLKFDIQGIRCALGIDVRGVVGDTRLWRKLLDAGAAADLELVAELVGMGSTKEEIEEALSPIRDRVRKGLGAERLLSKRTRIDAERAAAGESLKRWPKLQAAAQEGLDFLGKLDRDDPELARVVRETEPKRWRAWIFAFADPELLARYNARDVVADARIGVLLEERLRTEPDLDRFRRVFLDRAATAIAHVERWGVAADRGAILAFDAHLGGKIVEVQARLDAHGIEFDPDSRDQVERVLFTKLGLKPIKLTDSGNNYSTAKDVLAELAGAHPLVPDLIAYRRLAKLRGTYAGSGPGEGLFQHVRSDERVHSSILLDGAGSGRTSSSDPNMQNVVSEKRDPILGKMSRDCFIAPAGFRLLSFDYSQIELRCAAMLTGDPEMRAIFEEGVDYHQRTAEIISQIAWKILPADVRKEHRAVAKNINFALFYGAGDAKVVDQIRESDPTSKVTEQDVARVRAAILGRFKKLAAWQGRQLIEARRTGEVWTWWDGQRARRRPLPKIADQGDDSAGARINAENSTTNTPIQGTASDFLIASLVECVEWILREDLEDRIKLILPVHDQLLFEVREDYVDSTVAQVIPIMTGWPSNGVPLAVDTEIGQAWGSLERYEPKAQAA